MFFHGVAEIFGPSIFGLKKDIFGSYIPAVIIAVSSSVIGLAIFYTLEKKKD